MAYISPQLGYKELLESCNPRKDILFWTSNLLIAITSHMVTRPLVTKEMASIG